MPQQETKKWIPTDRQKVALDIDPEDCFEIGFGGARGGGKTETGIFWLLYDIGHPEFRALVIRRNADDLRDWLDRANNVYKNCNAVMKGVPSEFYFPSGAVIRTGHLKDENAYSKYVGHEYHRMLIEELNLIPSETHYLKLISSCRSTIADLPPQIFSTFNPSDTGFEWIKNRFRLSGTPKKPIWTTDDKSGLKRAFIPSRLEDNPHLAADPQYRAFLEALPDGLREAWKDGSWDTPIIEGAYFSKEMFQMEKDGRTGYLSYDPRLRVHTVWDLGISKENVMAIGFVQR